MGLLEHMIPRCFDARDSSPPPDRRGSLEPQLVYASTAVMPDVARLPMNEFMSRPDLICEDSLGKIRAYSSRGRSLYHRFY